MSYFAESAQGGRSSIAAYVGTDTQDAICCGNFMLRLTAGNAIEVKAASGTETAEIYRYNRWAGGAYEAQNFDSQTLTATTWTILDNLILNDGTDMIHVWICRSAATDSEWVEFRIWHPTATKICLMAQQLNASPSNPFPPSTNTLARAGDSITSTINGVSSVLVHDSRRIVHHHRINLGDAPSVAGFNSNAYQSVNWVPRVAGRRLTTGGNTAYAGFGLNWRINALNQWELYGDAVNVAAGQERWIVDIVMTRHSFGLMKIYGTFN